ncbi:MAG: putative toxin-antitoxin system toxin component, PIN family [Bacteroidales bacterium]|nr:putative toxin-antitoxin system toxin component, PIN family [Bacteroidales bacterium]
MKVILDCNIWVSFLIGHHLSSMREILTSKSAEVYCCPQLIAEVVDVTNRDKIRRYVTDTEKDDLLCIIQAYCHNIELTHEAQSAIRDPKDLYLLSLAEAIQADFIVSGDSDLLVLGQHKSTRLIKLSEFTNLILG